MLPGSDSEPGLVVGGRGGRAGTVSVGVGVGEERVKDRQEVVAADVGADGGICLLLVTQ